MKGELVLYMTGIIRDAEKNIVAFYDQERGYLQVNGDTRFIQVRDQEDMFETLRKIIDDKKNNPA